MSLKKPEPEPPLRETIREHWSDKLELGGSKDGHVACYNANQVLGTVWRGSNEDADTKQIRNTATLCRLSEIGPHDVVEAMLGAQLIALHEAAMEAFRRAALAEQTFAGREVALKYGAKLSRTYAALVDALDRHRGKGQPQVVRVERVTVEAGGRAIVGAVTQGGGAQNESEDRPHAQAALAHAPEPALRCPDPPRKPVPVASGEGQATLPDARRDRRQRRTAG
jgi:hypothetical protein